MPESMQIELHNVASAGAASGNNPFLQMVDWCEKSIARLILGQTLTSGADGKSSTNALGNVHNEVRRDLMISDAKQIAQTITQQIILRICRLILIRILPLIVSLILSLIRKNMKIYPYLRMQSLNLPHWRSNFRELGA